MQPLIEEMDDFHPNSRARTGFSSIQIQGERRGGYKLPGRSQQQFFHGKGAMAERKDGHDAAAAASASTALDGVEGDGKTAIQDDAWLPSDSFVHEPPVLKVMQPKGTFCEIQARFSVALPPDGVYDIITDPNNRRVFKNIKVLRLV